MTGPRTGRALRSRELGTAGAWTLIAVFTLAFWLAVGLLGASALGTAGHDSQFIQGLDADWYSLHPMEREQGCYLISYYGIEAVATVMSVELSMDQDMLVMMLDRHCPKED